MPTPHHSVDVAIIGAGPSGLFAVFECGFLGYSCAVIDALPQAGGQLAALYPEKPIYDIPGHPHILAGELVEKLKHQAAPYAPLYALGEPVEALEHTPAPADATSGATPGATGHFVLRTPSTHIQARALILAGGGGMFIPRKPKLAGLEEFEGTSVHYAVQKIDRFKSQTLVIAGGGDSAVDWAVALAPVATHVHVVHRRDDFRAAEETVRQMHALAASGKITLHTQAQLHALEGTAQAPGTLSTVHIANLEGQTTPLQADHLLCFFGLAPSPMPFESWGVTVQKGKVPVQLPSMATNKPGIFAIGDLAEYDGKISLILVGFAEAAMAAKSVQEYLNPEKKFKVQYSTSKGIPNPASGAA